MRAPAALGAVTLATAVVLAGVGATASLGGGGADAASVVAYEQRVLPVVKDWGSIEVLGMRPAVADLRAGTTMGAPDVVRAQARAWRAALLVDRDRLRAARPPASLRRMAKLLDESLALYLRAVDDFTAATTVSGAARLARIEAGIARAREGAEIYDEASAVLAAVRRDVGLPASTGFPVQGGPS